MVKRKRIRQKTDYFIPLSKQISELRATIPQIMYFVQIAQTRRRANLTRLATAVEAMIFVK